MILSRKYSPKTTFFFQQRSSNCFCASTLLCRWETIVLALAKSSSTFRDPQTSNGTNLEKEDFPFNQDPIKIFVRSASRLYVARTSYLSRSSSNGLNNSEIERTSIQRIKAEPSALIHHQLPGAVARSYHRRPWVHDPRVPFPIDSIYAIYYSHYTWNRFLCCISIVNWVLRSVDTTISPIRAKKL